MSLNWKQAFVATIACVVVSESSLPAAVHRGGGAPTPPRVAFIDGPVSFWRPGAADWVEAQVNMPLAIGDALYAGDAANVEIQTAARAMLRAGSGTEIDLTALDPHYIQLRVPGGHVALDLQYLPAGETFEIDTPNGAFTVNRAGYYRADVDDNRTAFSVRHNGFATVVPLNGQTVAISDAQQVILDGTDTVQLSLVAAPDYDQWDQWNISRAAQVPEAPRSAQYVAPQVAGVADLDRYGDWREEPRYGHVWVPHDMPPDWAPYSTGRWVYDPYYQWTWLDEQPWGWAPYHYGRWTHFSNYWGWAPGPVVAAPVYSPALVAFFGGSGIGVSVSVGVPGVSWVALGFGEPVVPWWGGAGFAGTPYWGGWGGPHVVNNTVINNTRTVNITNITNYQNANVPNAVLGVDSNQFGRGRVQPVRLDAQRYQQLRPLHGDLNVRPVAASLVPRETRGVQPPDRLQARSVVATRAPQDPTNRVRAMGLQPSAQMNRPEARIVRAHGAPVHLQPAPVAAGAGGQPAQPRAGLAPAPEGQQQAQPGQPQPRNFPHAPGHAPVAAVPPPAPGQVPAQRAAEPQHPTAPGPGGQPPRHGPVVQQQPGQPPVAGPSAPAPQRQGQVQRGQPQPPHMSGDAPPPPPPPGGRPSHQPPAVSRQAVRPSQPHQAPSAPPPQPPALHRPQAPAVSHQPRHPAASAPPPAARPSVQAPAPQPRAMPRAPAHAQPPPPSHEQMVPAPQSRPHPAPQARPQAAPHQQPAPQAHPAPQPRPRPEAAAHPAPQAHPPAPPHPHGQSKGEGKPQKDSQ